MPIIKLENIAFAYSTRGQKSRIFDGFNFSLQDGERVGLAGPNGCGKTTLLRLIMGLSRPSDGEIWLFNKLCTEQADFAEARRRIGFVFQDADDQLFCPTVEEDIAFGPLNLGLSPEQARARSREALAEIGLPDYGARVSFNLSGGEKKLVALGTALAMQPELLILDEPTTGLDKEAEDRLEAILKASSLPCLIVSHDIRFISRIASRVVRLEKMEQN